MSRLRRASVRTVGSTVVTPYSCAHRAAMTVPSLFNLSTLFEHATCAEPMRLLFAHILTLFFTHRPRHIEYEYLIQALNRVMLKI